MPKIYRLLTIPTVEAELVTKDSLRWIAQWSKGIEKDGGIDIPTQHGVKRAEVGNYVVRKMSGDFRVELAGQFLSRYTLVMDSETPNTNGGRS